jgi:phosphatidylserine/phosphatidylglycerophosphate/cardiolipin synthase-like enzyme
MDFNAQPSYLEPTPAWHEIGTRGFAITTRDQADVREIQSVFDADWSRQTPGPLTSSHLVWSPNGAGYAPAAQGKERIFALMDSARRSLDVYALLLDYRPFLDRLAAAARRGVTVRVISNTSPAALTVSQLQNLTSAGVQFAFTPEYPGGSLFIHTKAMIRDAGTSQAMAFVGSENPGDHVSMNSERELGILVGTPAIVQRMHGVFTADWQHAKPVEVVNGRVVDPFHG